MADQRSQTLPPIIAAKALHASHQPSIKPCSREPFTGIVEIFGLEEATRRYAQVKQQDRPVLIWARQHGGSITGFHQRRSTHFLLPSSYPPSLHSPLSPHQHLPHTS